MNIDKTAIKLLLRWQSDLSLYFSNIGYQSKSEGEHADDKCHE